MKKLIHRYLSEYFHIVDNKVRRKQLYNDFDLSSYVLIKELEIIFSLDKKALKWYTKSWIKTNTKAFNFNDWWTPKYGKSDKSGDVFPIAQQIAARTIGMALVDVQPMEGFRGELHYLNYQYGGIDAGYVYTPYITAIVTPQIELDHVTPDRLSARYATREVNPNLYGEINLVEMDRRREEVIRHWQNAGFLDGLTGYWGENIELFQQHDPYTTH